MKVTLLVGETGAGKSSLIQAILKARGFAEAESVRIGHGSASCTMDASLFDSGEPLGYLVDTRGTDDSKANTSDVELLNSTMREMYGRSNGNSIEAHVIWMCNSKTRATASYQTQARFIQSLFAGYGAHSNWGSVMVVIQKGSTAGHQDAPVSAASLSGCRDNSLANRVVMADVLGWGDPNDTKAAEQAEIFRMLPSEARKTLHKYEECEFVEEVSSILSTMPSCTISFRNRRCTKCGQRGDDRFFMPSCHPKEQRVHSQRMPSVHAHVRQGNDWVPQIQLKFRHDDKVENRHPADKIEVCHRSTSRRHLGHLQHPTITQGHCSGRTHGRIIYEHEEKGVSFHPEELVQETRDGWVPKTNTKRHHFGSFSRWKNNAASAFLLGVVTAGTSAIANVSSNGDLFGNWSCCGDGPANKPGCIETSSVTFIQKTTYGRWYHPCCGKSENMPGCVIRFPCCDQDTLESSVGGCRGICATCNNIADESAGCMCDGCGNRTGSGFCTSVCNECQTDLSKVTTQGCQYSECDCSADSEGCVFDCCNKKSPGCVRVCNNCGNDLNSPPCKMVCLNCEKDCSVQGCIEERFCEGCARPWNDTAFCMFDCCFENMTHDGCIGVCGGCGEKLPKEGCSQLQPLVQHIIVDVQ